MNARDNWRQFLPTAGAFGAAAVFVVFPRFAAAFAATSFFGAGVAYAIWVSMRIQRELEERRSVKDVRPVPQAQGEKRINRVS